MKESAIKDTVEALVSLALDKKAQDIRVTYVAKTSWMTDYIVVIGFNNDIHGKALSTGIKHFFAQSTVSGIYQEPRVSGESSSGWTILDANSIVVHCINEAKREFYGIDSFFEQQGDVYHY